jgi:hypothetical protein
MKDWKMWAPLQTKKQREVADNLSASEKEEATRLTKELGMKSAFFGISCSLVLYFLYEYTPLSSNVKLLLCLFLFIAGYLLFLKFVGLPVRNKQRSLLNNSKYAKEKGITV